MSHAPPAPTAAAAVQTAAPDDFLARFYRQMGLYAVAAALNVSLEPAAPVCETRPALRPESRKAA